MISQALTWSITIVVMRLLTPADYGLLAMATVFMSILVMLAEAGLGAALVQTRDLDDQKLRKIFGATIIINMALFIAQYLSAPFIASIFQEERLTAIIRVLSFQIILMIFSVVPGAMLNRQLNFKYASIVALVGALVGSLTTLALASTGFGVWSLIYGSLMTAFVNTIGVNLISPFLRRPDFSINGMREIFIFGGQLTFSRLLWLVYSQADVFIAGRILGKELLGFYSVGLHLASLPVQRISSIFNQVAFAAFAKAQDHPETIPSHMLKGIRTLSLISFPVLWGISSVAPEIVTLFLGEKWVMAIMPLQILPLVMPITLLSPFMNTAFQGIGKGNVVLMNTLTACILMPAAFLVGSHWGLLGLCLAWLIGFPLVFLVNLGRMLPVVGLSLPKALAAFTPPFVAATVMYLCVAGMRSILIDRLSANWLLVVLVLTGACSYFLVTVATNRAGGEEVVDLFKRRQE